MNFNEDMDDIPELNENFSLPEDHGMRAISDGDIMKYLKCPYSYYLSKHVGLSKLPRSLFAAQAMFFEQARKKLFNVRDPDIGRMPFTHRAGPSCKTVEEMDSGELQKYLACSAPEAFGGMLFWKWKNNADRGFWAGSPLLWTFKGQSVVGANQLQKAGTNYYQFVLENGAPIQGFMNTKVSFDFEGLTYTVKIPELRPGMKIDDPAIWSFNSDIPGRTKNDIGLSPIVTLRILGYCTLAHQVEFLRMKWGVTAEIAEGWTAANPIGEEVEYRHLYAMDSSVPSVTTRTTENLDELRRTIDDFITGVSAEKFEPRHQNCASCQYNMINVNGEPVCHRRRKGKKPSVPKYYLENPLIVEFAEDDDKVTLLGYVRNDNGLKKLVARMVINLEHDLLDINADVVYESRAYGYGFEDTMIESADALMAIRAGEMKKEVRFRVDYGKYFDFDGKMKAEEKLRLLEFAPLEEDPAIFAKTYQP